MKKVFYLLTVSVLFLAGCSTEELQTTDSSNKSLNQEAARGSANATYGYLSFSFAMADNGHTMYVQSDNVDPFFAAFPNGVAGGNTLSVDPKSVQGTGVFFHNDENGNPVTSGTWTATKLLSFKNYGPAGDDTGFPFADGRAGFANIRVHLVADAGPGAGAEFDATLQIRCLLPGNDSTPPSWVEGIRITVQDGLNFNKTVEGGGTLFLDLN
jgi:hypothetical protein